MTCSVSSHAVALATAMAVSGTLIFLVICRQRPPGSWPAQIPSRLSPAVHRRGTLKAAGPVGGGRRLPPTGMVEVATPPGIPRVCGGGGGVSECRRLGRGVMPANWVALYSGMLRDRNDRVICSY
ncbi:unnamed protein product [Spirodela intermedia]|uniref:Uncharacterized protein n=1 Tax=Spirodela intermedia TaxID=51605 RepID=A0A7I8JT98_SPIIN|nr:unnamed protein product [Spirodela intermedia]CAA6672662.1 unnamed protein product [Spirodela intermedia]